MTEIKNWLFGQDGWKTLRVLDERQNYNLKCIFEPKEDIVDGIGYRGVRCTIHNISPFWYGDEQIITFNHSDLTRDWKYFSSVGWSFINIEVPDNGCADVDILPRLSVEFDRSGSIYGTYYGSLFNLISVDAPSVADVAQNYNSNSAWNYKDLSGISFDYAYITENSKTTAIVSRNMREDGVLEILLGEDVLLEIPDGEDTDEFMKTKLNIAILLLLFAVPSFAQIEGYWKGQIELGGQQLEMAFNIKAAEKGFSATLDVPAQGAFDVPVDKTVFQDNHLQLTLSAMGASYSGTLKGEAIEGEFTQHGMAFPLNLAKGEKEAPKARPQDPQPPFNYRAEEVTFTNKKEGPDSKCHPGPQEKVIWFLLSLPSPYNDYEDQDQLYHAPSEYRGNNQNPWPLYNAIHS